MKCGGKSERLERMMDLTVEIEGEIATLEEALQRFTSTETLDGENKYHCVRLEHSEDFQYYILPMLSIVYKVERINLCVQF